MDFSLLCIHPLFGYHMSMLDPGDLGPSLHYPGER
jgi:hypothetical protein